MHRSLLTANGKGLLNTSAALIQLKERSETLPTQRSSNAICEDDPAGVASRVQGTCIGTVQKSSDCALKRSLITKEKKKKE